MSTIASWQEALLIAGEGILTSVALFLPNFFGAIIVFLIGLILGKAGKKLTVKVLETARLSTVVKKSGLEKFLDKAEIKIKIEEILGGIIKWLIVLIFSVAAINILGLSTVSVVLERVLSYIPRVISAILVLTIGVLLAGLVESLLKGAIGQIDIKASRLFGKIGSYLIVVFTTLAAINELGIAQSLINILFMGFVAMLALGFGLAIGLGAKDLIAQILTDWYKSFKKEIKK
jgi:hypothetical protein